MSSSNENVKNRVVIIGHPSVPKEHIVQALLDGTAQGSEAPSSSDRANPSSASTFPWTIDNKYYSADLIVTVASGWESVSSDIWSYTDAVIAVFNAHERESFDFVKKGVDVLDASSPTVQLCIRNEHSVSGANGAGVVSRDESMAWCVENGFESIQVKSLVSKHRSRARQAGGLLTSGQRRAMAADDDDSGNDNDDDDDDDDDEIERICQALHSNVWENLVRKDEKSAGRPAETTSRPKPSEGAAAVPSAGKGSSTAADMSFAALQSLLASGKGDWGLDEEHEEADVYFDDFDKAFDKLKTMKDRAAKLPDAERKALAEAVALSFWSILGGEDEDGEDSGGSDLER